MVDSTSFNGADQQQHQIGATTTMTTKMGSVSATSRRKFILFSSGLNKSDPRRPSNDSINFSRRQSTWPSKFLSNLRSKSVFSNLYNNNNTNNTNNNQSPQEMHPMMSRNPSAPNALLPAALNSKRTSKNSFKSFSTTTMPIRQNWSEKTLSKSKIKTLKLTVTVVIAYILCSVPFYVSVIINYFMREYLEATLTSHKRTLMKVLRKFFNLISIITMYIKLREKKKKRFN